MIIPLDKKVLSDASSRYNKTVIKNGLYAILVLWESRCFGRIAAYKDCLVESQILIKKSINEFELIVC